MAPILYKKREFSFTLVETILAIGLIAPVILNVASVQGNAIYFMEYGRQVSEASWLAKRIMTQVEYHSQSKEFGELVTSLENQEFQELEGFDEYKFDLSIQPFKLPIAKLLAKQVSGGGSPGEEQPKSETIDPQTKAFEDMIESYLGDGLFNLAKVTVFWSEGAKRNTTSLSLILYDEKKVDSIVKTLQATSAGSDPGTGSTTPTPSPGQRSVATPQP